MSVLLLEKSLADDAKLKSSSLFFSMIDLKMVTDVPRTRHTDCLRG